MEKINKTIEEMNKVELVKEVLEQPVKKEQADSPYVSKEEGQRILKEIADLKAEITQKYAETQSYKNTLKPEPELENEQEQSRDITDIENIKIEYETKEWL